MITQKKEKPKHLGRGLQSLISPITFETASEPEQPQTPIVPNLPQDKQLRDSLFQLDIDSIAANPYQPRTVWDEQQLSDLAESIKTNGVIQPIIVRQAGEKYELIAGERRFRASKMAGLTKIPAIVRKASDEQMLELALVENIHRSDLNPLERAKAYQNYINAFSLTQAEAAGRLGENRTVVTNYLRLLDLPSEIQQMLTDGSLSMGHARAILGLDSAELQKKLAQRAMAGRLSVREVERLVRKYTVGNVAAAQRANNVKPSNIMDLERRMREQLGTKVNIDASKKGERGRIVIEYYSLDEFERITQKMGIRLLEEV